jgi:hypothetical protein
MVFFGVKMKEIEDIILVLIELMMVLFFSFFFITSPIGIVDCCDGSDEIAFNSSFLKLHSSSSSYCSSFISDSVEKQEKIVKYYEKCIDYRRKHSDKNIFLNFKRDKLKNLDEIDELEEIVSVLESLFIYFNLYLINYCIFL